MKFVLRFLQKNYVLLFEVRGGLEPPYKVLQALALPLGHLTI